MWLKKGKDGEKREMVFPVGFCCKILIISDIDTVARMLFMAAHFISVILLVLRKRPFFALAFRWIVSARLSQKNVRAKTGEPCTSTQKAQTSKK